MVRSTFVQSIFHGRFVVDLVSKLTLSFSLSVKKEIAVLTPVRMGIRIMFIIHRNKASSRSNLKVFKKVCTNLSGLKLFFCG